MSISAIVTYYNRSEHIDEALESIFRQTLPADEVIVADDGSRPEEARHIDRYADRARILHYENRGAPVSRNRAIAAATSDWIAFLDDDDVWAPERLEKLMRYIDQHPECDAIHNASYILGTNQVYGNRPISLEDFLFSHPEPFTNPGTVMMKRELFLNYGMFNAILALGDDHELYMRMTAFRHFHCVNEPLTGIRRGARAGSPGLMTGRVRLYHNANRVWTYHQGLYPSEKRRKDFAVHVNASILSSSLYKRAWAPAAEVVRNCCPIQGISRLRVIGTALARMVRNRLGG